MKKLVSILAALSMVLCLNPFSANALSEDEASAAEQESRMTEIFNLRIEQLETQANELLELSGDEMINIEISCISTIYDFAGNEYTLAECEPTGYLIYHNESGTFVEASAVAPSPYLGCDGEKIYGGPNEYYVKAKTRSGATYSYTMTDEVLTEDLDAYIAASEQINDALVENKNTAVLNYVNNGDAAELLETQTSTMGSFKVVNNYKFFSQMTSPGYCTVTKSGKTYGICGYIAAGMLLTYEQVTNGGNVVDSKYYSKSSSGVYSIKSQFPKDLYELGKSLGYDTDTTSVAIHYTVKKYFENKDISASHTSLYAPIANNAVVATNIGNDRPVAWFGLITSNTHDTQTNITHAVVVYGYHFNLLDGGYSYVAHFGWNNANIVSFSGVIGSMYAFTVE